MAKQSGQKAKLLYLQKILQENTDEDHALTLQQITDLLQQQGITAERKSLYDDMEALRSFGVDVEARKAKNYAYYIGERDFQLPEIKLLVDAIQASKFITVKKSEELIRKMEKLCSRHEAKQLHQQVFVANRPKAPNEQIYYTVNDIHTAIAQNKKIQYQYAEWSLDFSAKPYVRRTLRHGGQMYRLSPWALLWDDENYYMIGFDSAQGIIKHFRVDKMSKITLLPEQRDGEGLFAKMDLADYSKRLYGMFSGQEEAVRLQFCNHLIGVVVDRFGPDVTVSKADDEHFFVNLHVVPSPQFFAWLYSFGEEVRVISPAHIRQELWKRAIQIVRMYEETK